MRTLEAQAWLREQPPLPEVKALLGYALLPENPKEAKGLLEGANLPFALALGETGLPQAYAKAPFDGPIRSALGLGEDPWGGREPGPSLRTLYAVLLRVEFFHLREDFLKGVSQLPLPLPERARPWAALGFFLLLLYHLLTFLLPRRRKEPPPSWPWGCAFWCREAWAFPGGLASSSSSSPPSAS